MPNRTKNTMTQALRDAIRQSGLTYLELEKQTGLKRASLMRFVQGEQSLRLDLADQLAEFFGIEVRAGKQKGK
jgi:transcriptional regulator with XRE-family HTH domain